jgi:hypothetical protein
MILNQELILNKWKAEFYSSKTYTDSAGNTVTVAIQKKPEWAEIRMV